MASVVLKPRPASPEEMLELELGFREADGEHGIGHNGPPQRTLTEKLSDWYAIKGQAAELADREKALRTEIFKEAFPEAKEKGTERVDIGFGKELKAVTKLNYTVDREGLAQAIKDGSYPDSMDRVVKYKPEVVESELLKLTDPKEKAVFASFITSKPGLPALEIVDAKKR